MSRSVGLCVWGGKGLWCRLHANTVTVRGYGSKNCKEYLAKHRTDFALREVKGIFGGIGIRKSGTNNRDCGYKVNKTVVTARLCSCLRYERRVLKSSVGTHSEQNTHGISYWRKSKNNHTVKWGYEYSEQMVGDVCVCLCSLLHSEDVLWESWRHRLPLPYPADRQGVWGEIFPHLWRLTRFFLSLLIYFPVYSSRFNILQVSAGFTDKGSRHMAK